MFSKGAAQCFFNQAATQQSLLQRATMVAPSMTSLQYAEFSKFRKRIGLYSFKLTKNNRYKNPHAMPLEQRQQYQKQGYRGELKIRDIERNSDRPFGEVSSKGRFKFNVEKVPFYNIPDLTGFKVSSYCIFNIYIAEAVCCSRDPQSQ